MLRVVGYLRMASAEGDCDFSQALPNFFMTFLAY